jgi:hypothetical protein
VCAADIGWLRRPFMASISVPYQQNQARCENRCQNPQQTLVTRRLPPHASMNSCSVLSKRKGVSRINGCRCRTLSKLALEPDWSKMEDRIRAVEIAINQRLHDLPREGFGTPTELHAMAETRQRLESLQAEGARSMKSTIRTNRAALVAPRLTD